MDKSIQFIIFEFSKTYIIVITLINFQKQEYIEFPKYYFAFLKNIINKLDKKNILNIVYYYNRYKLYIINNKLFINDFLYTIEDLKQVIHCICNLDNLNNKYEFIEIKPFKYTEIQMLNNIKYNIEKNIDSIDLQYINM